MRKGRNGKAKRRQGHEYILKFPHSSPASFEIGRQWVVEAHRAGPLTLAALRLPGAEAPSGGILLVATSFQPSSFSAAQRMNLNSPMHELKPRY